MLRIGDEFSRAQLAIAALFCSLGFQYATWAARLPLIKAQLGLTEAELGMLLTICGAGAALSFPLVTILMRRLGARRLAILAALSLVLLLPAMAAAPSYPIALVVMCIDGIAVGCLNVAMNAQGAMLEAKYQRTTMARFHAMFSGGSLSAAVLASGMHALTPALMTHFCVASVILLILIGFASSGLLKEEHHAGSKNRRRLTRPSRMTIWIGFAMALGTVAEGAMNDWSALYLRDVADAAATVVPMGIAMFSVMMVLSRILADGWRSRFGDGRVVRVGSSLAAAGLAFALLVGGVVPALIGFACVGLGIAAVTPCMYVAAARRGPDTLALVAAMGTIGLLAGPAMIGFIANAGNLAWGMGAVAAAAFLVALCSTQVRFPVFAETR